MNTCLAYFSVLFALKGVMYSILGILDGNSLFAELLGSF